MPLLWLHGQRRMGCAGSEFSLQLCKYFQLLVKFFSQVLTLLVCDIRGMGNSIACLTTVTSIWSLRWHEKGACTNESSCVMPLYLSC